MNPIDTVATGYSIIHVPRAWLSSDRLAVFLSEGVQYLKVSLSVRDLTTDATQRLTRSFSVEDAPSTRLIPAECWNRFEVAEALSDNKTNVEVTRNRRA